VQVDLDNPVALGDALQAVDSEWHKAQHLQEELRLERAKLLQVATHAFSMSDFSGKVAFKKKRSELSFR
jgi:hypothetical protein